MRNIRILSLSLETTKGGADLAGKRIAKVLKENFNILYKKIRSNFSGKIKYFCSRLLNRIFLGKTKYLNSLNIFSRINLDEQNADLIHINWIGQESISLNDLINTKKPILWTIHDLWPITSTEHFLDDEKSKKYSYKNIKNNFLKKIIFDKKKKLFLKKNLFLVSNSKWIENFARKSDLTKHINISTIYNPIDHKLWFRKRRSISLKNLNLEKNKTYILYGAFGGLKNYRKGGDLLIESLKYLQSQKSNVEFIVLGSDTNFTKMIHNFKFNFRKFTSNSQKQISYHSVASLTVIPSRGESIPQFSVETILCKNPVVAYNIGGLNEVIYHKKNGYLAKSFDTEDFAKGIKFCLNKNLKSNINYFRNKVINNFNKKKTLKNYRDVISKIDLDHK